MTDELKREVREADFLRRKYLDQVIGLLREARNKSKEPRLHLIDTARALLEEWKRELIEGEK